MQLTNDDVVLTMGYTPLGMLARFAITEPADVIGIEVDRSHVEGESTEMRA